MNDLEARAEHSDLESFCILENNEDSRFLKFFLTLNTTSLAVLYLCPFITLDACYCSSRYR